jgi:mono/diheme cytochrome c family protein
MPPASSPADTAVDTSTDTAAGKPSIAQADKSSRRRLIVKTAILTLLGAGTLGAAVGLTVYRAGWYNIGATSPHFSGVYRLLEGAMRYSVRRHANSVVVPHLTEADIVRGAAVYRDNCAQCHGGPGFAPSTHGLSMQPVPGPLVDATARWKVRELYWITRHGVKMSGMPAWEFHLSEADTWAVVAFVNKMPAMSARDYRMLTTLPLLLPTATPTATKGQAQ